MFKKFTFLVFAVVMLFSGSVFAQADEGAVACTMEYAPVCGINNETYSNACHAEAAGFDVSYNEECLIIKSEEGLSEEITEINFAGQLIEVGTTDIPTNIIVRENGILRDYVVNVDEKTVLGKSRGEIIPLSSWIPGDQIRVIGEKNENTEDIRAIRLENLSFNFQINKAINGWITKIDEEKKEIAYQWMNKEYIIKYDDGTRMVAGLKNPASIGDLKVNDRIRGRAELKDGQEIPLAKIIVVLRREGNLFMKMRTFKPWAILVRMNTTVIPTTIQVKILPTPGLKANDVNNLIGQEDALVTVNVTENSKLVRKYFGRTNLEEFSVGDKLEIIGRVNDDGTVDAKVIKNNSIWKTNLGAYPGVVVGIDKSNNFITLNWTPIKQPTREKLKQKLSELNETFDAQNLVSRQIEEIDTDYNIRNRVKNLKDSIQKTIEKIGQLTRKIVYKKVKIDSIKQDGLKLGDLIERRDAKKIRIDIGDNTKIIIGDNLEGTIDDIRLGDKLRVVGVMHASLPIVLAEKIAVVSFIPETEEDLETSINAINEVISEIKTEEDGGIAKNGITETEEEIIADIE
jgi:hypothetical protein